MNAISLVSIAFLGAALVSSLSGSVAGDEGKGWPNGRVVLVNHRGLSPGFPENTLAAIRNSVAMGVEVIEVDLRSTKDRVPVIMHDDAVDRTTDGKGKVEGYTLSEIKKLDAGSHLNARFAGERVPTYEEVLEVVLGSRVKLLLDIKQSELLDYELVVRLTEKRKAVLDIIVGARSVKDVRRFRALNPNIRILGFIGGTDDIEPFIKAGADIIRLWPEWIYANPALVAKVHGMGKPVWSTVNDAGREELLKLIRLRVNGLITNLPHVLAELMRDIDQGKVLP